MSKYQHLPNELKSLVRFTIDILGECIQETFGKDTYDIVESCRQDMASTRVASSEQKLATLQGMLANFKELKGSAHYELAHSFSLYLELINRCETAYRHHRLRSKHTSLKDLDAPYSIIFVFTAHPTEARSSAALKLLKQIEILLIHKLKSSADKKTEISLRHLIMLLMRLPLSVQKKPTVADEANHLYSIILDKKILTKQIELQKEKISIQFRTWVGGDKDGHPFVNEKTMVQSWNFSRASLLNFIKEELKSSQQLLRLVPSTKEIVKLNAQMSAVLSKITPLRLLKRGDATKVTGLRKFFEKLSESYQTYLKTDCPHIDRIKELFWLYPALVVPLEIREDSALVTDALKDKNLAVVKMLKNIKHYSNGELDKWYVRGFVISMTEEPEHLIAGQELVKKTLGSYSIPVVPLFETRKALETGITILDKSLKCNKEILATHKKIWGSRFEVMLGYSDSSKESGVIESRLLIARALQNLDEYFKSLNIKPVFFHGSGGSVERGGGSIKEQTSWWPESALETYKSTIQGEMVSRNFGDSWIMESMVTKIVENFNLQSQSNTNKIETKALSEFAFKVAQKYQEFLKREDFVHFIKLVTPYAYLDELKIGSRPTKRQKDGADFKLRAIPWVLCWTQTRILFPTWWGIGSIWNNLAPNEKADLIEQAKSNQLFQSFLNGLSFTLSKIELEVFQVYLNEGLPPDEAKYYQQLFAHEYNATKIFYTEVTGQDKLLWFKPWLKESIELRSSMIHPLNLLQIIALQQKNSDLLRETVTGISCGMMTTG